MSRKDGVFPKYHKIEESEEEPSRYNDSHRRCPNCDRKWPDESLFLKSPCCQHNTLRQEGSPDVTWTEALKAAKTALFDRIYNEWNGGTSDEELVMEDFLDGEGQIDDSKIKAAVDEFLEDVGSVNSM